MKQTVFVAGPSDIKGQNPLSRRRLDDGSIKDACKISGILPLLPFVHGDATLRAKSAYILIGIHKKATFPNNACFNLFNLVGDADSSVQSLGIIREIENKIHPDRIYNRVSDVLKTSRETLPKTLSDISGCRVPRVKSSNPESYEELATACEAFDAWPLIIRARGYHGGERMCLVQSIAELDAIRDKAWLYEGIHLIEFVDYKNEQGLYQKNRVIIVDGVPYPRHAIISDRWLIHAHSRADIMQHKTDLCRQEAHFLEYLSREGLIRHAGVFTAMQQRIGLDVWGVDFALVNDQIVIFEANACMKFLTQDFGGAGRYRYLEPYPRDLKRAIKKMLMNG